MKAWLLFLFGAVSDLVIFLLLGAMGGPIKQPEPA